MRGRELSSLCYKVSVLLKSFCGRVKQILITCIQRGRNLSFFFVTNVICSGKELSDFCYVQK